MVQGRNVSEVVVNLNVGFSPRFTTTSMFRTH
jgi:hypothetical protein